MRIQGPSTAVALLNRGNTDTTAYAIDLQHAANVTLDHLSITGAYQGINAADGSQSTGLTVSNSVIFGNYNRGLSLGATNDRATITGSTFYGVPGGTISITKARASTRKGPTTDRLRQSALQLAR